MRNNNTSRINSLLDLSGKVALITGGAMGIGKSIATYLSEAGASVFVADIVPAEEGKQLLSEWQANGVEAEYMEVDLRNTAHVSKVVKKAIEVFGRIDILVNNAGMFKYMPALDMTEKMWDDTLNLNLKSAVFLAKEVAKTMIDQGVKGRIINISSVDSFKPSGQLSHYDASKGGLRIYTKALAKELAPFGITVNDIAPGGITTPGTATIAGDSASEQEQAIAQKQMEAFAKTLPMQRMGKPEDIAKAVLFMASDACSYMTGSTMVIDGGLMLM